MPKEIKYFTDKYVDIESFNTKSMKDINIDTNLYKNIDFINKILGYPSDLIFKEFNSSNNEIKMALCYIEGISNKGFIESYLLSNLMIFINNNFNDNTSEGYYRDIIQNHLNTSQLEELTDYSMVFDNLLSGNAILLIDNIGKLVSIGTKFVDDRAIDTPQTEHSVKGPKDCFIETLRTNTALIRQKIKNVNLRMDSYQIGEISKTDVVVSYIEGLTPNHLVEKVKSKIKNLEVDALIDSTYLEREFKENKYNVFPVSGHTERPDLACIKLLEGRVLVLVDGTPFVLFVPYFFRDNFKSVEEYYRNNTVTMFIKILRYVSFFLTIYSASIYVAITSFHHEMLPGAFVLSFAQQFETVPTPIVVQIIIMMFIFEILKETSYRLPILTSVAILFVSGLVISENMIEAGLVPPIVIVIIALTVVTNYIFRDEDISGAIRIVRIYVLIMSSVFGLLGIILATLVFLFYLSTINTMGYEYINDNYFKSNTSKNKMLLNRLSSFKNRFITYIKKNIEHEDLM